MYASADTRIAEESARGRMKETEVNSNFVKMVNQASEVYSTIAKGSHGEVPMSVKAGARCIAVLPNVMTGALVIGGTHGEGLVSCKDAAGAWSQPIPISLNQGSIGLQAGAKSTDLVLYIESKKAEQALKDGSFAIGADVSAVAGKYDAALDVSTAGVVVYSRTNGVFAGASVSGSNIRKDEDQVRNFYGRDVNSNATLNNTEAPDSTLYSKKLTDLFPL